MIEHHSLTDTPAASPCCCRRLLIILIVMFVAPIGDKLAAWRETIQWKCPTETIESPIPTREKLINASLFHRFADGS
jgi:hypothetical protein